MARLARFKIAGTPLDSGRPQAGTVTVDRGAGTITVRAARRRKVYTLPLAVVASMMVARCIKAEVAETRAARKPRARRSALLARAR